jgi:hypothetical protein
MWRVDGAVSKLSTQNLELETQNLELETLYAFILRLLLVQLPVLSKACRLSTPELSVYQGVTVY